MEIASLILGIISIILSFIPVVGIICYLPAIIGIILGIVALATMKSRGKTKKAMPIIGIITSGVSMILSIIMIFVWTIVGVGLFVDAENEISNSISNYNSIYNSVYNSVENKISNSTYDEDDEYDDSLDDMEEYDIGEKMKSDYCTVVINKIEKFSGSSNLKADSGKELIMVDITVTNTSDYTTYVSKYDFEINDGYEYYFAKYDASGEEATFKSGNLEKGESMTGTLCFQKDEDNDDYYIVYNDEFKVKIK